jgi:putative oxidoreductase
MNVSASPPLPARPWRIASWIARIVVAVILGQTLFFKFTAAPESVYIFEAIGQEPVGRIGSGVVELVAVIVLLFAPQILAVGALLALGVMSGAIFFHFTSLGLVVQDDGGLLFALAWVVWLCSLFLLWMHRRTLPVVGSKL